MTSWISRPHFLKLWYFSWSTGHNEDNVAWKMKNNIEKYADKNTKARKWEKEIRTSRGKRGELKNELKIFKKYSYISIPHQLKIKKKKTNSYKNSFTPSCSTIPKHE